MGYGRLKRCRFDFKSEAQKNIVFEMLKLVLRTLFLLSGTLLPSIFFRFCSGEKCKQHFDYFDCWSHRRWYLSTWRRFLQPWIRDTIFLYTGSSPLRKFFSSERKLFSPKKELFSPKRKLISPGRKLFSPKRKLFPLKRKLISPERKLITPERLVFFSERKIDLKF